MVKQSFQFSLLTVIGSAPMLSDDRLEGGKNGNSRKLLMSSWTSKKPVNRELRQKVQLPFGWANESQVSQSYHHATQAATPLSIRPSRTLVFYCSSSFLTSSKRHLDIRAAHNAHFMWHTFSRMATIIRTSRHFLIVITYLISRRKFHRRERVYGKHSRIIKNVFPRLWSTQEEEKRRKMHEEKGGHLDDSR